MNKAEKTVLYDFSGEKSLSKEFKEKLRERTEQLEIVETGGDYTEKLSKNKLSDAEVFISRVFDNYTQELFKDSELQYIGVMATDKSHYPLNFLEENNVRVSNISDYARESVAELTINMMLHLSLRNYETVEFVKEENWDVGPFPGNELRNKELGIIGLGSIGSRVAEIAEALGMNISYYSRSEKEEAKKKGWVYCELDDLLESSDVISIHCSLNENTEDLLDAEKLEKVKKNAIILNAAREEIQDIEKTIELCEKGELKAWFDALEDQKDRRKILETNNAVLTSHSGCATEEALERLKEKTLNQFDDYLKRNK